MQLRQTALAVLRLTHGHRRSRKRLRHALRAEPQMAALSDQALKLAALVAVAEQLAALATRGWTLASVVSARRRTLLRLRRIATEERPEERAPLDLTPAATLWRAAFGRRLRVCTAGAAAWRTAADLAFDGTLAAAGRWLMAQQFARLRSLEPALGAEASEDAVHDARVAARRLRTQLRLFRRAYPRREVRSLDGGLRRLGKVLGAARDADVLLRLLQVQASESAGAAAALASLSDECRAVQQRARTALKAQLNAPEHRRWWEQMGAFLASAAATERGAARLCERGPALIWKQYGAVRTAARDLPSASLDELHALRKAVRRLRYLLEGLQPVLGGHRTIDAVIGAAVEVQDALGALHDADQLLLALRNRLHEHHGAISDGAAAALRDLLSEQDDALASLRRAFIKRWPRLNGRRFRKRLGRVAASL